MKRVRREFSPEFKADAVRLVKAGGKQVTALARELNVSRQLLYQWVREADEHAASASRGKRTEQAELEQLRRENARLKVDIEILKKAKAFFAKHHR
jgi:transposase